MSDRKALRIGKASFTFSFTAALIVLALSATISLGGCSGKHEEHGSASARQAEASPWKIELTTEPAQPNSGEETTFRVAMKDDAGNPVSGAKVEANLKMKSHDMGKNVVALADKGQGMYEGQGKFSMAGPWDVVVIASKDGKSGAQTFQVVARKD